MGWSSNLEWPKGQGFTIDLASRPDRTVLSKGINSTELKTQGSNLIDSQGHLYFQCVKCLDIFDPETKSFKSLNDKLDAAKWKRVWNEDKLGFKVYCVKCKQ